MNFHFDSNSQEVSEECFRSKGNEIYTSTPQCSIGRKFSENIFRLKPGFKNFALKNADTPIPFSQQLYR